MGNARCWTMLKLLETMDEVSANMSAQYASADVEDIDVPDNNEHDDTTDTILSDDSVGRVSNDDELLDSLNQIFTPILVMQGFEENIAEKIQESYSEANVLMERNIISFDNEAKMAQLLSVCALLIARQKNSPKYQMYKKAMEVAKSSKLEIQKDEYDAARSLAQKFLIKVSTTNGSTVARKSANDLLPLSN